jgi:RNA polymerase-interacting CarD/CdnL/TRCF family regulator
MKSSQVKNCFDEVLRILRKYEELQENTKVIRDGVREGLEHWKKRAETAEETLRVLAGEGQTRAELITERDALLQKMANLSREHTDLLEALHKVTSIVEGRST